jgi:putative Ca2+/H+ antiporter (TMEM165/GDT1 family)
VDLRALFTAFGVVFLAELPDKTAYTQVLLASRHRALPVLAGAWLAFLAQGFIALALGSLLARLPPQAVRYGAAAVFLFFGVLLLVKDEPLEEEQSPSQRKAFFEAFALVFLAEMGDATQIGTAALVARMHAKWSVFAGATLALWTVSALAVTVGRLAGTRLPRKVLRKAAGVVFCLIAVLSAVL